MYKPTLNFLTELKKLTQSKERHIKGHSLALLKRLQELNTQDEEEYTIIEEHISLDGKSKCTHYSDGGIVITNIMTKTQHKH